MLLSDDHSRVVLSQQDLHGGSDYISASHVDASFLQNVPQYQPIHIIANIDTQGYEEPRGHIVAQGPVPDTINDFWRMIWEQNATSR